MDDYALALQLQADYDDEESDLKVKALNSDPAFAPVPSKSNSAISSDTDTTTWSLADERWELIDPAPDVRAMFLQFNEKYFWKRLDGIEVRWSPRMTLCAGVCSYEGHGGLCSVRLSEPLLKLRPRKDLVETLLHEMIHAYLFVTDNNKDHDGHGPEFHKHMYRINKDAGLNISVYHTFHDEVDNYRQHWWRCDGPCQQRKPYYGIVKRAMNRAPAPRDTWWAEHQRTCGGTYTKIKEPEGYGAKKGKKDSKEDKKPTEKSKPKGNVDIRVFGSKGNTEGDESKKPPATAGDGKAAGVKNMANGDDDPYSGGIWSEVKETKETFPGQGKSVVTPASSGASASATNSQPGGPIVRRLPGIGIITNERHGLASSSQSDSVSGAGSMQNSSHNSNRIETKTSSGSTTGNNNQGSSAEKPTSMDKFLTKTPPNGMFKPPASDEAKALSNGGARPKVQPKPNGRKSTDNVKDLLMKALKDDSPIGTVKKIPGFMSVSNKRQNSKEMDMSGVKSNSRVTVPGLKKVGGTKKKKVPTATLR